MAQTEIVGLLNGLIEEGLKLHASDIHIEPRDNFVSIRYRVDGILQYGPRLEKDIQAHLLSRLKVMVNLDIAESRLPQDGRGRYGAVDLRISTIPTIHGEKIVIRLLELTRTLMPLADLGLGADELKLYREMTSKRSGLVLVVGPTGAGKTTTLYATLKELNYKECNITTIEDPVEYQLFGINQVQVNYKTGLTFVAGLRSILRQDPDVILVGEIRDIETARIAVQAALTGHLVFSTLHTNDSLSAITRLLKMGIEPYLLSASLVGVVAQRLCRKKGGGRIGIFEMLKVTETLRGLLSKSPDKAALQRQACIEGLKTLMVQGKEKISAGSITNEELLRVISPD